MANQPEFMLGISQPQNNYNKNKLYKTYIVIFNTSKEVLLINNILPELFLKDNNRIKNNSNKNLELKYNLNDLKFIKTIQKNGANNTKYFVNVYFTPNNLIGDNYQFIQYDSIINYIPINQKKNYSKNFIELKNIIESHLKNNVHAQIINDVNQARKEMEENNIGNSNKNINQDLFEQSQQVEDYDTSDEEEDEN